MAASAVTGVIGASQPAPAAEEPAPAAHADEPVAAQPARRPRRSRRAVSSGVVTPGETKIITVDPGSGTE
ncbi:hypothetical protein [Georgenia sp. SUBG003]|uniref:hypothetical protein n=1 Tax=Georgenia sp. SUBG003 TaxID=1497974 RepID=UPI003AB75C57